MQQNHSSTGWNTSYKFAHTNCRHFSIHVKHLLLCLPVETEPFQKQCRTKVFVSTFSVDGETGLRADLDLWLKVACSSGL